MYTTVAKVRIAGGIVGNLNISTASIESKVAMANGVINGKIIDAYVLPLAETPEMITEIASQLAAAFVLIDEYGKEAQGTDKDGYKRLGLLYNEAGTGILDQIQKRQIKIISDTTSTELETSSLKSPAFRPNDTSTNNTEDRDIATAPYVKINQVF